MAFELRRYSTAGMAMATAGVIALSPVTVSPPDLHLPAPTSVVATRSVDLTGFVNPLAVWGDVLTTTVTDIGKLAQTFAADPFPLTKQVIANQVRYLTEIASIGQGVGNGVVNWAKTVPESLRTMAQQLAAGQISDAVMSGWGIFVNGVVGVLFPVLQFDIPQQVTQNIANAVKALTPVLAQVGFAVLNTMYQSTDAFGDIAQNFYNAVRAGDIVTAASELINAPANLTGAVLNGWGEGSKGVYGIFGSFGVVNAVMQGFKTIADAIKPPAPEAPVAPAAADDPAAVASTAVKALAPASATKPVTTAAVKADDAEKVATSPAAAKDPVAKEDSKVATEPAVVNAPDAKPDTTEPATKVETTKPADAATSDPDSAAKPEQPTKAEKAPKATKAPKAKAPKPAKKGKDAKKALSAQQSANAA